MLYKQLLGCLHHIFLLLLLDMSQKEHWWLNKYDRLCQVERVIHDWKEDR